jgi:hypothetical protein
MEIKPPTTFINGFIVVTLGCECAVDLSNNISGDNMIEYALRQMLGDNKYEVEALCHGKCKLTFPNSIPIIVSYNEPQFY